MATKVCDPAEHLAGSFSYPDGGFLPAVSGHANLHQDEKLE
jgi:hypothetical protein